MAKNIVVFSDGTGQDGGVRPDQRLSNIYKLFRASRIGPLNVIDPAQQVAFYDPGLGTDDDVHGFGRIWRTIGKLLGSVAGRGIGTNIIDCYEFIINYWEPGDRIFLFGFSRGAYTARCVAQVLSLCGVPRHEVRDPATPFRRFARSTHLAAKRAIHQVYEHGAGHPRGEFEAERDEQARRFRVDYGSDDNGIPNAAPYFIGVFDTVAALGAKGWKFYGIVAMLAMGAAVPIAIVAAIIHWIFGPGFWLTFAIFTLLASAGTWLMLKRDALRYIDDFPTKGSPRRRHWIVWRASNYDRGLSGRVDFARQASAIDEDREDFPRVAWGKRDVIRKPVNGEPPPLVQLWFAADHSDIGGSYPETESRLSDVALEWMIEEVTSLPCPLTLDHSKLNVWPDHAAMQHSELIALRDRKLWWVPRWMPAWLRDGWAYAARRPAGSPVHPSVHARFAESKVTLATGDGPYRPPSLSDDLRFAHFYSGDDPATPTSFAAAKQARYRVFAAECIDVCVARQNSAIATLLRDNNVESAALIVVAPWEASEVDAYRDRLSQRCLERYVRQCCFTILPAECLRDGDSSVPVPCLFIVGANVCEAAHFARSIGQTVFAAFSSNGIASLHSAFASPAS